MWHAFAASLVERRTGGGAVGPTAAVMGVVMGVVLTAVVTVVAVSVEGKGSGVSAIERR